ncbi:hypothetical protein CLOM_g14028 [Closterium sp. NIES-68]|nr:hypothetical protein CLOM_g14028 [Closterium sp. NIES-68]GJP74550.1 hypothetical protein CLOP_g5112 [Closterium sp. NIES-67]
MGDRSEGRWERVAPLWLRRLAFRDNRALLLAVVATIVLLAACVARFRAATNTTRAYVPPIIVHVVEDDACVVPGRHVADCRLPRKERVNVMLVSAMWTRESDTRGETEVLLKSLLHGTRCPLHLHFIIAGEPELSAIRAFMAALQATELLPNPSPYTHPTRPHAEIGNPSAEDLAAEGYRNGSPREERAVVVFSMYMLPMEYLEARTTALHLWPLAHHSALPGMSKFFTQEMLWQVQRTLYMDADMLVGGDVQDVWELTSAMDQDDDLLLFIGNNHPETAPWRVGRPFCAGLLMLDLQHMRKANFTQLFVDTLGPFKPKELPNYVEDGDQFLYTRVCMLMPHRCRLMPRLWNVAGCSSPPFLGFGPKGREANGTCWQNLHFNCIGHKKGAGMPPEWQGTVAWARGLRFEDLSRPPLPS